MTARKLLKGIMLLSLFMMLPLSARAKKAKKAVQTDREYWCELADKMARPVLENMSKGELQKNMQMEFSPSFDNRNRKVAYMETFGRLMAASRPGCRCPTTTRRKAASADNCASGPCSRTRMQWILTVPTICAGA